MSVASIVFLDRDGTIIKDAHFPSDPDQVELLPGAAASIARLNEASVPAVVVTNQSGIGRGYYDVEDYERVHQRMLDLLLEEGARIDASFFCPHAPDHVPPCDCRKPRPALFERALSQFGADPTRAYYIGDRLRDVIAAATLGGTGVLIPSPMTPALDLEEAPRVARTASSLDAAVSLALGLTTANAAE